MGTVMGVGIVCEFNNREECGPIVLLEISTNIKVLLDYLVNLFQFTIGLWVEGSW